MIDSNVRLTVPDEVVYREIAGEAVLLNLDSEAYYGLDEAGVDFWSKITEAENVEDAFDRLLAEYEVEPAELRSDLEDFVTQMLDKGLLEQAS